jgi:flagellar hook-associated protein FlgK
VSLLDAISTSSSGLNAADTQINVAATNIANANTPGYKAERVDSVELSTGGVATTIRTTNSSVDLAKESTDLVKAKNLYAANGMVIKATNQMLGSLLNMFDKDHTG